MAYSTIHPTCQTVLPNGALCGTPAHVVKNVNGRSDYRRPNGFWICSAHYKKITRSSTGHYSNHKKIFCENIDGRLGPGTTCTSNIVHDSQLTVDHIDGCHTNDDPGNLQTLCHNCHVLKTRQDTLARGKNGNTGYRPVVVRPSIFPPGMFEDT